VFRATPEPQGPLEQQEILVHRAFRASKVFRVYKATQAQPELMVLSVQPEPQGQPEQQEILVHRVSKVFRVYKATQVQQERQEPREPQEILGQQEQQEQQEPREPQEILGQPAQLVHRVFKAFKAP